MRARTWRASRTQCCRNSTRGAARDDVGRQLGPLHHPDRRICRDDHAENDRRYVRRRGDRQHGVLMTAPMDPSVAGSGVATAMTAFVGSPMNTSGVAMVDMQPLVDKLSASNGTIQ